MPRPRKSPEEKRSKWQVLNVTTAERAAITAAAGEAGLSINDYILACTRQTKLVRRGDREQIVRLLAGIEDRLEEIARQVMAAPLSTQDVAGLLLALRGVESSLRQSAAGRADMDDAGEDLEC